jgi:hypothetical protein
MADFSRSRKSKNVKDFRGNKPAQDAFSLGNKIQKELDTHFMELGARELDGSEIGKYGASLRRKQIDSYGTKGKGRAGAGSRKVEKILRAYERRKWDL